ncbi:MAG: YfhO family protein [Candidatus Omnitrophica bacterium]|nr:YfhO family protein [Candidatus Omnitrophota bacterium]
MDSNRLCQIPTPKKRDALYLIVLAATVILFHPAIFFARHIPLDEDSLLFFYPLRAMHSDPQAGFWDPYLFCGFPRDANPQSQLLYSPNLLFQFLPTGLGFSLLLIGHLFLGAGLMYYLLRGLRLSCEASFFGALAFLLSTFWRCKITNLGLLEGVSWTPGIFYFFLLSLESGQWTPRMACALFLGMTILAGVPHVVVYTMMMLFLTAAAYILLRERPIFSTLSIFLTIALSSAVLTIGMWLPALLHLPESGREALTLSKAMEGSIDWMNLWKVFLGGLSQPEISRCDPWEGTCYIGATTLFFIPAGFMMIQRRLRIALALILLFAILCTLGEEGRLYPFLYHYLPGWKTLNLPNRSLMAAAIALPIFSAFGLQFYLDRKDHALFSRLSLAALSGILFAFVIVTGLMHPNAWLSLIQSTMTSTFQPDSISDGMWSFFHNAFWLGMTAGIVFLLSEPKVKRTLILVLLFVMAGAQSALYSPRLFLQTVSSDYFDLPRTVRLAKKSLQNPGERICSFVPMIDTGSDVRMEFLRPAAMQRLPEAYRISEIQGYDPLFPKRYGELVRTWAGQSRATDRTRTIRLETLPKGLLNLLGVSTVIGLPNQEILYTGKTVEIDQPGGIESPFKQPKVIESISFRWLLAGASRIPQGALVAKVAVMNGTRTVQTFPVRTGVEIANYIMNYPDYSAQHTPAKVFRWFPIPSRFGYLSVQQYQAEFRLDRPSLIDRAAVEFLFPAGRMAIMEIDIQTPELHGLELLGASAELPVYANPGAFAPAYLSRRIMRCGRIEEMIDAFESYQPGEEIPVFFSIDDEVPFESSPIQTDSQEQQIVRYTRPDSDHIAIHTRSQFDGMLVVTENYSPNWSAKIDGKPAPVFRANHAFMAVPITAGEHDVSFDYLPRLFFISISIGGSMLSFVILLLAMHPRRWLLSPRPLKPDSRRSFLRSFWTRGRL